MDNNIFKFATKELSQDAFLCWCINWINMEDKSSNMYKFGKDMLFKIIFNKSANSDCKDLKEDFNNDNITIRVIRQFNTTDKVNKQNRMDVVVTINSKYVIIIEDKIDATVDIDEKKNDQLKRYKKAMKEIFDYINKVKNKKDRKYKTNINKLELLGLSKEDCKNTKIIPVLVKTGKVTEEEKKLGYSIIDASDLLKVIEEYITIIDKEYKIYIKDFCENIKEKVDINNTEKYNQISNNEKIKIGEKFSKNITVYNCFYKYFDIIHYTAKKYVNNKGIYEDSKRLTQNGISMNSKGSHVQIWNPKFVYSSKNWKNERIDDKFDEISEKYVGEDENKKNELFSDDILLRYVFSLERDEFGKVYYLFRGLYKNLDYNKKKLASQGRKWKRITCEDEHFSGLIDNEGNVSINVKEICELITKLANR